MKQKKKDTERLKDWRGELGCYHGHCITSRRDLVREGLIKTKKQK